MAIALTAALAGVLALAGYAGSVVLLLAVAMVQGLLVAGWYRCVDVPGATGGMLLAGAASGAADLLLLLRDDPRPLAPATGVLGLAMVGTLLHQLVRRPERDRVTASLTATATLTAFAVLTGLFISAEQTRGGASLVAVVAVTAVAGRVVDLLPSLPSSVRAPAGVVLGGVVGAGLGSLTVVEAQPGLLLGLGAAASAAVAGAVVRRFPRPDLFTAGALPLAVAGPVAYVLGRILVG
jgi:hypothetical protein